MFSSWDFFPPKQYLNVLHAIELLFKASGLFTWELVTKHWLCVCVFVYVCARDAAYIFGYISGYISDHPISSLTPMNLWFVAQIKI